MASVPGAYYAFPMMAGRRSWAPAWWAAGGMLLVPLAALVWLTPAAAPTGSADDVELAVAPSPPSASEPSAPRASDAQPPPSHPAPPTLTSESDEPTGAVWGRVIDPDGRPLAGAAVRCEDRELEGEPSQAVTGPEGEFSLPAEADGCSAVATHRRLGESEPVQIFASANNALELRPGAELEGVVVDERGRPVDPCWVAIESYVPAGGLATAKRRGAHGRGGESQPVSDASGAFAFRGLLPGRYVLTASAAGRPPAHSDAVELGAGERARHVRIELAVGGTLEGRVVDRETGEAIADAEIALDGLTATRANAIESARSGTAGHYRLQGVPSAPFSVRVSAAGYRSRVVAGLSVQSGRAEELDLQLAPLGEGGRPETEYTGIGAALSSTVAGVIVAAALDGGPAATAGVQPDDRIVAIDGRSTEGLSVAQCVQLLRGPEGSRVRLTLERQSTGPLEVVLARAQFVH